MSEYGVMTIYREFDGRVWGKLTGRPVVLAAPELLEQVLPELYPGASFEIGSYILTLAGPAANGGGLWEVRVAEKQEEEAEE
jgi:hypothetical protein